MSDEKSQLFVADEDDMDTVSETGSSAQYHEAHQSPFPGEQTEEKSPEPEVDDDPIIESIPLVLNTVPDTTTQSVHILQYPGRPKTRTFANELLEMRAKSQSKFLQVNVPLETNKFYDDSKTAEWGTRVETQQLQGVLNESTGGLYAAKVVTKDGVKKMVLIPIDSTAQLRPSFKYLDDLDQARYGIKKAEPASDRQQSNVHILQSSSKQNTGLDADGFMNTSLGDSLRHIRKFEDEAWAPMVWRNEQESECQNVKNHLNNLRTEKLVTSTTALEYILKLTQDEPEA